MPDSLQPPEPPPSGPTGPAGSKRRYARDFQEGQVLYDHVDERTGLRGLVLRGTFSFCAYVGVPDGHVLASLEELEFSTYRGVTLREPSSFLGMEEGWFLFGWDYAHAGDRLVAPPGFPDISISLMGNAPKDWTLEEVVEHVLDALFELHEALEAAKQALKSARPVTKG